MCVDFRYKHDWKITRISILRTEHDVFDLLAFPFSVANLMNQGLLKAMYRQVFLCTERSWEGFIFHINASERRQDPYLPCGGCSPVEESLWDDRGCNTITYARQKKRGVVLWHRRSRFLILEPRVQFHKNPCWVLGTGFSAGILVFPCWYHSAIDPFSVM